MIWRLKILTIAAVSLLVLAGGSIETENNEISWANPDISPVDVEGVWVFNFTPVWSMDALMTGEAEIVNGCLVVDQAVVIWHSESMDEVRDLVDLVLSDKNPTVEMGGGGDSIEEAGSNFVVPSVIEERCSPVTAIWYGSNDPITITTHPDGTGCRHAPAPSAKSLLASLIYLF